MERRDGSWEGWGKIGSKETIAWLLQKETSEQKKKIKGKKRIDIPKQSKTFGIVWRWYSEKILEDESIGHQKSLRDHLGKKWIRECG